MKQNKNIPQGYKDSPLGIIPQEWEVKKLGDVCSDITSGKNKSKSENGNYPVFGSTGIIGYSSDYKYDHPMILVARVGVNAGLINEATEKCDVSDNTLMITPDDNYNFTYAKNQLLYINLNNLVFGSGQPLITAGQLKSLAIYLPPLPEQQKIAEILTYWDTAIEKQSQLIEKLETRKRGLMQQLLTGKKRLKGFEEEWQIVELRSLFDEVVESNNNQTHEIMTISAKLGLISQKEKFDRIIAGDSLRKYTLLKEGDFAYNKGNSNLYEMGCIYQLEKIKSALVPFVYICFRPTNKCFSTFYKHWFQNHGLDRQLKRIITSGARGDGLLNVNNKDFFSLLLPYPSLAEQTAIANILSVADEEIGKEKEKLVALRSQKAGLMQVLLTGKKRVKV